MGDIIGGSSTVESYLICWVTNIFIGVVGN